MNRWREENEPPLSRTKQIDLFLGESSSADDELRAMSVGLGRAILFLAFDTRVAARISSLARDTDLLTAAAALRLIDDLCE